MQYSGHTPHIIIYSTSKLCISRRDAFYRRGQANQEDRHDETQPIQHTAGIEANELPGIIRNRENSSNIIQSTQSNTHGPGMGYSLGARLSQVFVYFKE